MATVYKRACFTLLQLYKISLPRAYIAKECINRFQFSKGCRQELCLRLHLIARLQDQHLSMKKDFSENMHA